MTKLEAYERAIKLALHLEVMRPERDEAREIVEALCLAHVRTEPPL